MNVYELREHMKNKTPFIVYGDVCRYDPAIHEGDPHGWYRLEISKANIAVNVESEAEYYKNRDILLDKLSVLQTRLTLARDLIAVLSHNGMMPENLMVDKGEAWRKWQAEEMTK